MFIKYYDKIFKETIFEKEVFDSTELLLYGLLYKNKSLEGRANVTLKYLVENCGYKVNLHKGKSVEMFRNMLYNMASDNKYMDYFKISIDADIRKISYNKMFEVSLVENNIGGAKFTKLPFVDFDKIVGSEYRFKDRLLLVYLFIKSFIFEKSSNNTKEPPPKCSVLSYEDISIGTGVCISSVQYLVKELEKLELIKQYITKVFIKKKNHTCYVKSIYTLYKENESEVTKMKRLLKLCYNNQEDADIGENMY